MNDLAEAVSAYEKIFANLASNEAGTPELSLLDLLIARDTVARAFEGDRTANSEILAKINQLDQKLKKDATVISARRNRVVVVAG